MTDDLPKCFVCKGRGFLNASDIPGGPTREITCGDCCGTGLR